MHSENEGNAGTTRPQRAVDREMVARMIAGDTAAFDLFARTHSPALLRYALSQVGGDADLAMDLVQTTLCKAIQKLDTYRGEATLYVWLKACCRNELLMHFRKQSTQPKSVDVEVLEQGVEPAETGKGPASHTQAPEAKLLHEERSSQVHETLDLLPERYARALEWKYLQNLPVAAIARRLDLSPKAAESLLTRARSAFKTRFAEILGDSP